MATEAETWLYDRSVRHLDPGDCDPGAGLLAAWPQAGSHDAHLARLPA